MNTHSQVEPTDNIKRLVETWGVGELHTPEHFKKLRNLLFSALQFIPYTEETKDAERAIRWKRTGSEVIEDGYVYQTKACTDLVVAYLTLLHATRISQTRFVKLLNEKTNMFHSVAEMMVEGKWYNFDVANYHALPQPGEISENAPWGENGQWRVWGKGRDAWDLGLSSSEVKSS